MPRQPTGNPTGRPPGSGRLGEVVRLTVRLPTELYGRLEAFAEGRGYTRGTPELSGCVRALLEHALVCPYKRQTHNIPSTAQDMIGQTESIPGADEDTIQQTTSITGTEQDTSRQTSTIPPLDVETHRQTTTLPVPGEKIIRQTKKSPAAPEPYTVEDIRQTVTSTPVPQAEAVQPLDTALPRGLGPGDELPPHIRAIADARAHYDKLTLTEFAQVLFDRNIYRAQAKDRTEVPVNRGTLQRWLDRARQAGCL